MLGGEGDPVAGAGARLTDLLTSASLCLTSRTCWAERVIRWPVLVASWRYWPDSFVLLSSQLTTGLKVSWPVLLAAGSGHRVRLPGQSPGQVIGRRWGDLPHFGKRIVKVNNIESGPIDALYSEAVKIFRVTANRSEDAFTPSPQC